MSNPPACKTNGLCFYLDLSQALACLGWQSQLTLWERLTAPPFQAVSPEPKSLAAVSDTSSMFTTQHRECEHHAYCPHFPTFDHSEFSSHRSPLRKASDGCKPQGAARMAGHLRLFSSGAAWRSAER